MLALRSRKFAQRGQQAVHFFRGVVMNEAYAQ